MRGPAVVRAERGSASVLVVGAVGTVVLVLSGVLVVVGAVRDLHRVQAAADLAALAAAGGSSAGVAPTAGRLRGGRVERCAADPLLHRARRLGGRHGAVGRPGPVGGGCPARSRRRARAGSSTSPTPP